MKLWVPDLTFSRIVLRTESVTLVYRPSARAVTTSQRKAKISAITEEAWVDNDTLYFMQQIDAVPQQSEE